MVHEVKEKNLFQIAKNSGKEIGYKTLGAYAFLAVFAVVITVTFVLSQQRQNVIQSASYDSSSRTFTDNFDGDPANPQPFTQIGQNNWDVQIHSRNSDTWDTLIPVEAHHSPECGAPIDANGNLVTHTMDGTYEQAVFKCKNHVMTTIYGIGRNVHDGYGLINLTPNAMVDFTSGEATIKFDMSTLRTSARDWVDIVITPYNENLIFPFDQGEVDFQGVPKNAVFIKMGSPNDNNKSGFSADIIKNFQVTNDFQAFSSDYNWYTGYEDFMKTSPQKRSTFEIKISKTHLKFCMPAGQVDVDGNPVNNGNEFCWFNKNIGTLPFTTGIVTFGHHSYTPDKDCSFTPKLSCKPDTWHWDSFSISPATPFTMIKGDRRFVANETTPITFQSPAPANSKLRFSAIGKVQVSYNGGNWISANQQPSSEKHFDHFGNYFMDIPEGTTQVKMRFSSDDWYTGPFRAKDFAIWSTTVNGSSQNPTNTPVPQATNTPTPIPAATNTPTPTSIPLPTAKSTLNLSPASSNVNNGQNISVQLQVNTNGQSVNGVETAINYPSNRLAVVSVSQGNAFDVKAEETLSSGSIKLAYGATVPKTGVQTIATVVFKAISAGTANVTLKNSTVAESGSNTNVFKSSTGGTYTIVAPTSTPTPQPTATPTPQPTATPTPVVKPGDINNNGTVDIQDLSFLLTKWGTSDSLSDFNKDGTVNLLDLSVLLTNWGN